MRILLVESHPGVGCWAAEQLESSGHSVMTCHEGSAFPCRVFDNPSTCPIEQREVDAALVVHAAGLVATGYEAGVGCARRARLPIVMYATEGQPFGRSVYGVGTDVVAACEHAVTRRLTEHEEAAKKAVLAAALFRDGDVSASAVDVEIHRTGDRLHIRVTVPADVPEPVKASLADRAVRGVRSFDRSTSIIDVSVEHRSDK